MRKKILFTSISILIFLSLFISYLSIFGIKTNNFNNLISKKIKEYDSKLTIEIDEVFIKLNLLESALSINTKNANLLAQSDQIKISNIDINLNLIKFLKKENSIKNIKITSSDNLIKDVSSFLNNINYDLSRYIFYSQIKKGLINFEIDVEFGKDTRNISSYLITGSVNNAKFNLPSDQNINEINFNFQSRNKITKIINLNFIYQDIIFSSKNLEIKEENSGEYYIKGDIENSKAAVNPNLFLKFANIKQDYLSNKDILLESKNLFSFVLNKNKKLKNVKIDSIINFDEIYFNDKYQKIIFLKEGTIKSKFENQQLSADIDSNFAFSDYLKLENKFKNNKLKLSLKSKNNSKIKVNGNMSNEKVSINPEILSNLIGLDPKLLSQKQVNVETDNKFKFEINNGKFENYIFNSEINFDKLEINKQIQDILYLKNIKTKFTLKDKLLKVDLKSNYSFFDKKLENESDKNTLNLKLEKKDSKISDVEIFIQSDNNNIKTKELKKYFNFQELDSLVENQLINLNSNLKINAKIDEKFNIEKFSIKSDINLEKLNIIYKSNIIKNYVKNYENRLSIKNPQISFEYSDDLINLELNGKYALKDKDDTFFLKFTGNKSNSELYSLLDLNNSILNLNEIQYFKKKNQPSKLEIKIKSSPNSLNLQKINFTENNNFILVKNLVLSNNFKIQSLDNIDVNFYNENGVINNFKIIKNSNKYQFTGSQIDGERILEKILKGKNEIKFSNFFKNINTSVILNLDKIYLEKDQYLKKLNGEFDIKNNKLILAKADAVLENGNKFSYSLRKTDKNQKITNILIEEPKPFINNYKFIKGFEEGVLKLNSLKIDNTSRSNLKITNFKVKEVPILAKILTLASLQGIADLLTGEGIRFDKFEMNFKTKGKLTEIEEIYAIGPAISIIMEGYIEKDRLTSLKGTLVPATTINKTISKIPLIGDILVGSKTGEGVFGVSFKIKGPPNKLKSTVNPIKTLTPRFITRTLESLKGN